MDLGLGHEALARSGEELKAACDVFPPALMWLSDCRQAPTLGCLISAVMCTVEDKVQESGAAGLAAFCIRIQIMQHELTTKVLETPS